MNGTTQTKRVKSMRIQVAPEVADEYMRKPAELAPLPKELVHSIRGDGTVKLSKSMRELQRRWRNTVRIDEKLYAPDEMLDRAVLDNQGEEIGVITGLFRVKRTYKGVIVTTRMRCKCNSVLMSKFEFQFLHWLAPVSAWMKWCSHERSRKCSTCLRTSPSTAWKKSERSVLRTAMPAVMLMTGGFVGQFTLARVA